ncbi:MAG: MBL fold metallo-hydrolase [Candidatus Polarisedimenticolaceae bacterium]|nr:MBL fold metallo-hydrolase [Candidatus Polarisedimenticolaceae bacterium]
MKITIVPVTPFQQNCSILCCEETDRAAVVDPGGDIDLIMEEAQKMGVEIEKIFITHAHIDHAGGAAALAEKLNIPIEGPHKEDQFWIDGLPKQSDAYGFSEKARVFTPTRWLSDGDKVTFGNTTLNVLHCPGHTPGHVIFYHPKEQLALVGDVLFKGSIGRTDFPRGDHATLIRSIQTQLWPLGDEVEFIPGHGPLSTFGEERESNPFVGDHA